MHSLATHLFLFSCGTYIFLCHTYIYFSAGLCVFVIRYQPEMWHHCTQPWHVHAVCVKPVYTIFSFFWCLRAGCGDLCWLRSAPAGCLPVSPSGDAHRPLLQMQVQQGRRRPIANLNPKSELERRAASRMGHLFFPLFNPLRSRPPTSFECFIFFGLSLHQPQPLQDPSLCMREAWQESDSALWPEDRWRVEGQRRSDFSMDCSVHVLWDVLWGCEGRLGHFEWSSGVGLCGKEISAGHNEGKIKVKKCFYFSCVDNNMQEPRPRELLLHRSVLWVCRTQRKLHPHHHTQCSSTDSVRSIRVTPHTSGVHSLCTQNVTSTSCSRLR